MTITFLNMNGEALEPYQRYIDYQPEETWELFIEALEIRFGPSKAENLAGRLSFVNQPMSENIKGSFKDFPIVYANFLRTTYLSDTLVG